MAQTANISKIRYEELRKNPVFFLKYSEEIRYEKDNKEIIYPRWDSLDQ